MAEKCLTPSIPRLEMVNVPPCNASTHTEITCPNHSTQCIYDIYNIYIITASYHHYTTTPPPSSQLKHLLTIYIIHNVKHTHTYIYI